MDRIKKRQSRGLCLQLLFANNFSENNFDQLLSNFFSDIDKDIEEPKFNDDQINYASKLYSIVSRISFLVVFTKNRLLVGMLIFFAVCYSNILIFFDENEGAF